MLADSLKPRLGEILSRMRKDVGEVVKSRELPPCIKNIQARIIAGEDVSHFENFAIASYLINAGRSIDEVLELFRHRSDFDERIARYQVRHIAGLSGGHRYRPPSCSKLRSLGICIEDGRLCPRWIKNPLQYKPRTGKTETAETAES